ADRLLVIARRQVDAERSLIGISQGIAFEHLALKGNFFIAPMVVDRPGIHTILPFRAQKMTVFIREAHHSTKCMRSFPTGQIITKWERPVHLPLTKPTRRKEALRSPASSFGKTSLRAALLKRGERHSSKGLSLFCGSVRSLQIGR